MKLETFDEKRGLLLDVTVTVAKVVVLEMVG